MKENVILHISGLHLAGAQEDSVEMIHAGQYFCRNGKHYIKYQESLEDGLVSDNMIKVSHKEVEFIRKGLISTNMVFTIGEKNISYYETPFGSMTMGIDTSELDITEEEGYLAVDICYALDMNYEHMSDCHVAIRVSEAQ